ncbi:DUF438 domain-containing protein [Alkalibacter rhizosphaerae]|uniref:DUF438 domain-containing protein n=1 Tax=Alkalibacter rhizosphaerae TaxID=2815577 RepID=A0A974XH25_9FIRM|nr:PAS domain-containing protein [Alkalibacter rhizosphaerae]QSX08580.1 DUF438 domain-containing protein [Alkalibacter rhizosphaerae]
MEERIKNLIDYCQGVLRKENGKVLYERYLKDIQTITPMDLIHIENEQLKMGNKPEELLTVVDKLINVFYKYLKEFAMEAPTEGTFLYYLMEENKEFTEKLHTFKMVVKEREWDTYKEKTLVFLNEMMEYEEHLLKIENILFPMLEKKKDRFNGMQIMWALHDQVRKKLKKLHAHIEKDRLGTEEINMEMGLLYFQLFGLVQKQELILFPAAKETLSAEEFSDMHYQSREYGFPYIEKPKHFTKPEKEGKMNEDPTDNHQILHLETGSLSMDQIKSMLDVLPLDMTLVDEKDQVVYFSRPKERIFPRSPAIIGRNVRNCHPPQSVHVVEDILEAFKNNEKEQASFWIQRNSQFILIQYVALRDDEGKYAGTLEISQEVSQIRALEGERRLLQWMDEK